MTKRITPEETRAWFAGRMNERPDYGLGKVILDLLFHPRSPFRPRERRKFRRAFLWAVAWIGAAVCLFAFFNFAR